MKNLIGKKFRRNKYGLSIWEDKIKDMDCIFKLYRKTEMSKMDLRKLLEMRRQDAKHGFVVEIMVKGEMSNNWYNINEILTY